MGLKQKEAERHFIICGDVHQEIWAMFLHGEPGSLLHTAADFTPCQESGTWDKA
jgi:hypothetical protein